LRRFIDLKADFVAGGQQMIFKDLLESIGPSVARRPFYQPLEQMLAGHVPACVIGLSVAASRRPAAI
jgi:hypothetical protein